MEALTELWRVVLERTETAHPVFLFLAVALLPLAGVPVSPLWIAAGVRLGTLAGFFFALAGACVNITLGYWMARCWLRGPLTRFLEGRGWRVPSLSGRDERLAILGLRVTPGVPVFVQNYLLGLAKVHFGRYLLLSVPVQAAYVLAFVWFGHSLATSRVWHLVLGVAVLIGLTLLIRLVQHWLSHRGVAATAQLVQK